MLSAYTVQADVPQPATVLMQKLTDACQRQDIEAIKSCYELAGASSYEIDIVLSFWEEDFNDDGKTHYKLEKMSYQTLDDAQNDKTVNARSIDADTKKKKIGEHVYEPNLKVVGFITATFKDSAGHATSSSWLSVGVEPDGTYRLMLRRVVP